jgi:uncharacterized protein (TIGR02246 family)
MKMRTMNTMILLGCVALFSMASAPVNNDETQVRDLIPRFADAWAHADAHGIAGIYAADGDLVIPTGQVISGRDAIAGFYAAVFAKGYQGSKGEGTIERLRFVRPDVAVGDGTWSIVGAHGANGQAAPAERGVFAFVAVKQENQWLISALREQTSATKLTAIE